nr:amidohydrolase family protein [Pseudomonas sp. dw_358]
MAGAAWSLPTVAAPPTFSDGPVHLLIRHACVITMDPRLGDLARADVLIRDGRIEAVGANLPAADAQVLDAAGMILIPGLVDAHWHLWNSALRNRSPAPQGPPFFKWQLAISPQFTPARSALGVRMGLAQAVNAGITTINNWAHNLRGPAWADAELQAMRSSGLRGRLWYGYPQDLAAGAPMDFADILRVQQHLDGGAFDLGLAIRGPERTAPAIWQPEFAFARDHGLPISTHIAVTAAMQKKKAIEQLAHQQLLDASVQLVHCTHADADDLQRIAHSGASVCITPLSEMRVGYGLAPVAALHRANVPMSVGIDTLVLSGSADLFKVMQTSLNLACAETGDEQALMARDVLFWATQGGANAMGLGERIGSITVGKRADLTLIDGRGLDMMPLLDPVATVVQTATAGNVDTVIADGCLLKRGGRLLGVDVAGLLAQVAPP